MPVTQETKLCFAVSLLYLIICIANHFVLQIMGMTNNVRNIWWKMDESGMIRFYMMTSQKEKAYQCIISQLYNELSNNIPFMSKEGFCDKTEGIIEKYRKMVKEIGYELPDMLSKPDEFYENYKRIGNL